MDATWKKKKRKKYIIGRTERRWKWKCNGKIKEKDKKHCVPQDRQESWGKKGEIRLLLWWYSQTQGQTHSGLTNIYMRTVDIIRKHQWKERTSKTVSSRCKWCYSLRLKSVHHFIQSRACFFLTMLWMPSFDIEVASRIKSGWVDRIAIEVIRDNGLKSGLDSLKLGSKKKSC